jgi:catechol 2,3-dioxygenase-like lactoylglutathione lyase family enzyme
LAAARIEHVNLHVSDPERTATLLAALFGWRERWRGPSALGGWTIHVGNDFDYVAVNTKASGPIPPMRHAKGLPLNHVGVVVDDLDAVERSVVAHGLKPFNHSDYEPGRRFYFMDPDNIEYEVVSYAPGTGAAR